MRMNIISLKIFVILDCFVEKIESFVCSFFTLSNLNGIIA